MDRWTTPHFIGAAAIILTGVGLLISFPGCDTTTGEEYQTFSTSDAEEIEAARVARAEQQDDSASSANEASSLILAAAQRAARAALPAEVTVGTVSAEDEGNPAAQEQPQNRVVDTAGDGVSDAPSSAVKVAGGRAAGAVSGEPIVRPIKLLIPEQTFRVEGPDDALRVSYDDFDLLKVLNMEPVPPNAVDFFPDWLAGLDGKQVRVRGFMYPTFQETDIPAFVLARDNQICCFGRNPKIYDLVEVTLADGVTTDYIQGRPFDVVGNFRIRPEADGEELWQLYQIDDAIVIDE